MEAKSQPRPHHDTFLLPTLSANQKKHYLKYAQQILVAEAQMVHSTQNNLLRYTLDKTQRHHLMKHYPKGDRIDHKTGGHYFYHCHRENYQTTEHGHFHCFLRQTGIPRHFVPISDIQAPKTHPMTHLVAIAMNQLGQPIRLFTVNRWVSDDIWFPAHTYAKLVKEFKIQLSDGSSWSLVDQWIEGIARLFAPQIYWLYEQRDVMMLDDPKNKCEDRSLEEISSININLKQQIQWVVDQHKISS